jgi:methionine-rich copper-binding protein CopC
VKKVAQFSGAGAAAALLVTVFLFALPDAVQAHAYPDHADPKVGSTIAAAPTQVRIWFDSDLEPFFSTIVVQDAGGRKVDKGDGHVDPSDPTLLEVSLPPVPPGTYRVIWNVVARDTHRTMGNFVFTVK